MSAPESHTSADEALSGLMSAVRGSPEYSRLVAPPAGAQEPIGAHDLRTSKGGRGYVAEYVIKQLGRHDFTRYINEALAADFACALAKHLAARPAPAAGDALNGAARDVLAERQRQISAESWTPEHDDAYADEQLARAAVCYALPQGDYEIPEPPEFWPWDAAWWKPGDRRRELIKAGALILAEIERLDRAAITSKQEK